MNKRQFGAPTPVPQEELPSYLLGQKKSVRVLPSASADDFRWLGDDLTYDPSKELQGWASPNALLRLVLLAIIDANPIPTPEKGGTVPSREDRIATAMSALVGEKPSTGARENKIYEPLLRWMATEYFLGYFGIRPRYESLNALSLEALKMFPGFDSLNFGGRRVEGRSCSEIQETQDSLVARYVADRDFELHVELEKVRTVLLALRDLGLDVGEPPARDIPRTARNALRKVPSEANNYVKNGKSRNSGTPHERYRSKRSARR